MGASHLIRRPSLIPTQSYLSALALRCASHRYIAIVHEGTATGDPANSTRDPICNFSFDF